MKLRKVMGHVASPSHQQRMRSLPNRVGSTSSVYEYSQGSSTGAAAGAPAAGALLLPPAPPLALSRRSATRAGKSGEAWPAPIHSSRHG